jgi:HAD superfamily hydrolase (TIGR01549 family)
MIEAVIFDLDDTLLKTRQTKYAAIKYAGKKFYGLDISDQIISEHWGTAFLPFLYEVFSHKDKPENIAFRYKSIVRRFRNQPYPDALPTINALYPDYKLGLVSSAAKSLVMYDLKTSSIPANKFVFIQSAEDTSVHKPDPKVFEPMITAMATYNISPSQMLYVGDHLYDYQAATGAGMEFLGIANRTHSAARFQQAGAETINSLSELLSILKGKSNFV